MPHDPKIPKGQIPNKIHYGEKAKTKFLDNLDAIKVQLLYSPNKQEIYRVMYNMQRATWGDIGRKDIGKTDAEIEDSINLMLQGKSLGLGLEAMSFTFLVEGISRVTTHQIVRNRIGITYSQRCTGDQDLRHDDVLVPRAFQKDPKILERYKRLCLDAKKLYVDMVDSDQISIQDARWILPHSFAQYIYVHISFPTLMMLIGKRMCTNETIEYNEVARQMRELVLEKFPLFKDILKADCDKPSGCFFKKGHSPMNGNIYLPDEKHDFPYNKENFLYPKTRKELVEFTPFKDDKIYEE